MASFTVHLLDGVKASKRRAIAFLECTEEAGIDAHTVFQHAIKDRWETDERELEGARSLRLNPP
jgi:hypothetical protein